MSPSLTSEILSLPLIPVHPFDIKALYEFPQNAPAIFSTEFGKCRPRRLPHPARPQSQSIVRSDFHYDVREMETELRLKFPDYIDSMTMSLGAWPELFYFFDPVDIRNEGAEFLFCVIKSLVSHNIMKRHEIEDQVKLWMQHNLERLAHIPPIPDVLDFAFGHKDREYFCVNDLRITELNLLRTLLNFHYSVLQPQFEAIKSGTVRQLNGGNQVVAPHITIVNGHKNILQLPRVQKLLGPTSRSLSGEGNRRSEEIVISGRDLKDDSRNEVGQHEFYIKRSVSAGKSPGWQHQQGIGPQSFGSSSSNDSLGIPRGSVSDPQRYTMLHSRISMGYPHANIASGRALPTHMIEKPYGDHGGVSYNASVPRALPCTDSGSEALVPPRSGGLNNPILTSRVFNGTMKHTNDARLIATGSSEHREAVHAPRSSRPPSVRCASQDRLSHGHPTTYDVFVAGPSSEVLNSDYIRRLFASSGGIVSYKIGGANANYAFVGFKTLDAAKRIIKSFNGLKLDTGRALIVQPSRNQNWSLGDNPSSSRGHSPTSHSTKMISNQGAPGTGDRFSGIWPTRYALGPTPSDVNFPRSQVLQEMVINYKCTKRLMSTNRDKKMGVQQGIASVEDKAHDGDQFSERKHPTTPKTQRKGSLQSGSEKGISETPVLPGQKQLVHSKVPQSPVDTPTRSQGAIRSSSFRAECHTLSNTVRTSPSTYNERFSRKQSSESILSTVERPLINGVCSATQGVRKPSADLIIPVQIAIPLAETSVAQATPKLQNIPVTPDRQSKKHRGKKSCGSILTHITPKAVHDAQIEKASDGENPHQVNEGVLADTYTIQKVADNGRVGSLMDDAEGARKTDTHKSPKPPTSKQRKIQKEEPSGVASSDRGIRHHKTNSNSSSKGTTPRRNSHRKSKSESSAKSTSNQPSIEYGNIQRETPISKSRKNSRLRESSGSSPTTNMSKSTACDEKEQHGSIVDVMSDPSQWPALGEANLNKETKSEHQPPIACVANALQENVPLGLARRDSMASVWSTSSRDTLRTSASGYDSDGRPASQGWPVIKDFNGRHMKRKP